MKKVYILLIATVLLLLSACATKTNTAETKEPQTAVKEVKDGQETATEEPSSEEDKRVSGEEAEEEEGEIKPSYTLNDKNFSLEPISDANPKVALITIDDAPDNYALDMAFTLKKMNAPAIFFVNGHLIQSPEKEEALKEIHDLGFAIGNHTFSHTDLTTINAEKQREEIVSVNDLVEKITGERPKFFRAPFGKNTDVSRQIAEEENMLLMNWTYGYDWEKQYMTAEAIADIMVNTELLTDGANLLMHDREWTSAGLEKIVHGLREKGYELLDPNLIDPNN